MHQNHNFMLIKIPVTNIEQNLVKIKKIMKRIFELATPRRGFPMKQEMQALSPQQAVLQAVSRTATTRGRILDDYWRTPPTACATTSPRMPPATTPCKKSTTTSSSEDNDYGVSVVVH